MEKEKQTLIVSGYGAIDASSIHLVTFDPRAGTLAPRGAFSGIENPSFARLHPDKPLFYAVSEIAPGAVWAFSLDEPGASLNLINSQPAGGDAPCHITIDHEGRWLFVASYSSGTVASLPIRADGGLGEPTAVMEHTGSGPNMERQDAPHAHSTILSPDERFLIAADLGADALYTYAFDAATGSLSLHHKTPARAGAGPRHAAFHPDGNSLYVVNELNNTVACYRYNRVDGVLVERQVVSTVPANSGANTAADIHITRDGKRLFVSNRGHDSIAGYDIAEDGTLALAGIYACGGKTPRNFALSPDERYLLIANQESNELVAFALGDSGALVPEPAARLSLPTPTSITFLP